MFARLSARSVTRPRVLMFDIDGTLFFTAADVGTPSMTTALSTVFPGRTFSRNGVRLGGRVDVSIAEQVALNGGVEPKLFRSKLSLFVEEYAKEMKQQLKLNQQHIWPCAGVLPLLKALKSHEERPIVLSIVSGNFLEIGLLKLEAVGIDPSMFDVMAYGSDHEDRAALPRLALKRASEKFGIELGSEDALVIGDTAEDIGCAKSNNIPVLAVGTGCTEPSELLALEPDYFMNDLSNLDESLALLTK
jgi:phosphoglycolate phosphatase